MNMVRRKLSASKIDELIKTLITRFEKNMNRHKGISWQDVESRLLANPDKMWTVYEMELSEGEPDVIGFDKESGCYIFYDCSSESPKGRRSLCYDREGLESRKEHKPKNTAIDLASEMGVEILTEGEYRHLQTLGDFDCKTSSWLKTPAKIRKLGGAIFGDYRFETVFVYHNGAQSYYSGRAFRGKVLV